MEIGPVSVTFHRTVRVANGRTPAALPPSLGHRILHSVKQYRANCPAEWADDSYFMSLHDTEAMWMGFHSRSGPVAMLIGCGGINALTGEKLGTVLAEGNYLVAPPQPWLDGWKGEDGNVYQFVATPHKKGDGITVGEQLIGKESKTGAIGIAVFEPKQPIHSLQSDPSEFIWGGGEGCSVQSFSYNSNLSFGSSSISTKSAKITRSAVSVSEMGIGKGGKITQKIYPDPHGIEVWKSAPSAVFAVYLVDAATAAEITGETVHTPAVSESYTGPWFGLKDEQLPDVAGTAKFDTLKPVISAFPGDTSNVGSTEPTAEPSTSECVTSDADAEVPTGV